jgi:hypothetical protein
MAPATRIITDYSCALPTGAFDGLSVVGPEASHMEFGDPPSRPAYVAAMREAVAAGPTPVLCLVGPYGYSPAFTAASGARNDLGRERIDPNLVHVVNPGRAFLGLGALAASLASSRLGPEEALRWLDAAAPASSMWMVAETARVAALAAEYHVEAPSGFPDEPFALLRVRLASRVVGGFATVAEAADEAVRRAAPAAGGTVVVANADEAPGDLSSLRASRTITVDLPAYIAAAFGPCYAFGAAPPTPS